MLPQVARLGALALGVASCHATVAADAEHRPLTCSSWQLDTELDAAKLPGFVRGFGLAEDGTLFVASYDSYGGRTSMGSRRGAWNKELLPEGFDNLRDLFVAGNIPWVTGTTYSSGKGHVWLARPDGKKWVDVGLPPGGKSVVTMGGTSAHTFLVASIEPGDFPTLFEWTSTGWVSVPSPLEIGARPFRVVRLGTRIVLVGALADAPSLAAFDGERWSTILAPTSVWWVSDVSGTVDGLIVLGGDRDGVASVWSVRDRGRAWTLVHSSDWPYAGIWSPRSGVALLTPSIYHYGRLTVLDGAAGPSLLPKVDPNVAVYSVAGPWVEADGRTVHLLVEHYADRTMHHYTGTCD